jgi:CheY-like chemotaxis protein
MVLDLNMPDIGGLEVLEFVRGQDKLRALPIIVVTTRGDEGSRARTLQAGASRFMTKPFDFLAEAEDRRGVGMASGIEGVQAQASQISRSLRETAAHELARGQREGRTESS